jgi:RNA polymerase sigma-B factor
MKRVANATNYNSLDTKQLFAIYSNDRDIDIRNILIERHMYLANILSKKYINKGVEFEDIYQVASLALIYAIDRYNPEKGYEFSSFATPTIMGEIKKYFRDKVWTLKVPRRIQELSRKVNEVNLELQQKYHKKPRPKDIAEELNRTEEEVLEAMEASYGYQPMSLDISNNNESEDKDITLMDTIGQEDLNFSNLENGDFISKFIKNLNDIESKIFKDRFIEDKTQSIIAKELGVSQMTVSRAERKIIERLKKEYERL